MSNQMKVLMGGAILLAFMWGMTLGSDIAQGDMHRPHEPDITIYCPTGCTAVQCLHCHIKEGVIK